MTDPSGEAAPGPSGAPSPEAVDPQRARRRRHPLLAYVARRIAVGIGLVALVSVLVFAATNILPGDVAAASLGRQASPERKAALRAELGLDRPKLEQYTSWVSGIIHGDLGDSTAARQPVWGLIAGRITNTLTLAFVTMVCMVPLALLLGVLAGVRPGGPSDSSISGITLALISVPEFVLGTVLTLLFAVAWKVLPAVSLLEPGTSPLRQPNVLVLPVATLLLAGLAYMIRMVRAGVIEVSASPYVEMARLNGMPERRVITRYILRNSLAPTVQAFALTLQWLIGGVVIVETLFAYPGLGQGLVEAVTVRDLPLIQGIAILVATLYIAINIVADVLVVLLIPKLRTAQ